MLIVEYFQKGSKFDVSSPMSHLHTNKLSQESSPYLLQHAHNPVDWHPWGEEALSKAREQDKPILVSIGYAACHWCHVMERESFEDEATAAIMNEHFINIKIDREERPDLDHIYMDAVQAISGSGGWPLNVFLTPAGKPFYGGTYFPPKRAFNRPSWNETLLGIIQSYKEKRHEIDAQAENLTDHILQSNSFGQQLSAEGEILNFKSVEEIASNILKQADKTWGGFGKAPKFPQTFSIQYLLRNDRTLGGEVEERGPGGEVTQVALLSLDKMIEGGIYDQVGGGFARYSTDTEWLVPHFEKMLYDNALLVSVLSEAYQLTRNERYREVIEETIAFIEREMLHPARGFYAALDADSEGEEGKFYVWRFDEVKELLGDDAAVFSSYYEISESGNLPSGEAGWIGKNILHVKKSKENFSRDNNISINELNKILGNGRKILLEARSKRVRPQLDDKIILGWNALMNTALSKAFAATGHESYRQLAIDNMRFILTQLEKENGNGFYHTWKNDEAKFPGFLDDHAFLIQALIHLQEITADTAWLLKARTVCEHVIDNFSEEGTSFFYYTPADQTDVIIRKKEVYDGAVPSGNSTMAYNLFHLSILFDEKGWHDRSLSMLSSLGKAITRYPSSFGNWASLLQEMLVGTNEIAILGDAYAKTQNEVLEQYIPHRVLMAGGMPDPAFPLLAGKQLFAEPVIYLCRNYTCASPVFSTSDLMLLINNPQNR